MDDDTKVRRGTTTTGIGSNDVTLYEYFEARIKALRELNDVRFESAQIAIDKADKANEKRFESMNEFRGQLADQSRTFVNRETMEAGLREVKSALLAENVLISDQGARLSNIEGRLLAYAGSIAAFSVIFNIIIHFWK